MDHTAARERFRRLHDAGIFAMPNAFDAGSARILADLGFEALATTSSGAAATTGRLDMTTSRDELVRHAAALSAAVDLPVSVDAERLFPEDEGGVGGTVARLAEAGAAGCSIEDWDPAARRIDPVGEAAQRVADAAVAAHREGLVLTARAENHLRGVDDLEDTIARLRAYVQAGADCVFAPGLLDTTHIGRVVAEAGAPVSVLLFAGGPSRDELAAVGVRRLSIGGRLAFVAYGAVRRAALRLRDEGIVDRDDGALPGDVVRRVFT